MDGLEGHCFTTKLHPQSFTQDRAVAGSFRGTLLAIAHAIRKIKPPILQMPV